MIRFELTLIVLVHHTPGTQSSEYICSVDTVRMGIFSKNRRVRFQTIHQRKA